MTTTTAHSPHSVVEALRGERAARPRIDTTSAAGLRGELEDGLFQVLGTITKSEPIIVRASSLRQTHYTTDLALSRTGLLRGVLVGQLLRLMSVGVVVEHAFDDAVDTLRGEGRSLDLLEHLGQLDNEERARLATDVTAHAVTLSRSLGDVPRHWSPRTAVPATQRLGGGRVVLRDVVDLVIGSSGGDVASIVLFDLTTSPLGEGAERVLRYHALVHTLKTSIVPWRAAMFSTATGELWTRDVDFELLMHSVHEVLSVVGELGGVA